jgi:hypothetical protein
MSRPFLCPVGLRSPTLLENFETAKSLKTTSQPSHLKKRHRRYWRLTAQHYRSCSSGLVRTLQACCVETQGPSLVPSGAMGIAMGSGYTRSCVSGSECLAWRDDGEGHPRLAMSTNSFSTGSWATSIPRAYFSASASTLAQSRRKAYTSAYDSSLNSCCS